MASELVSALLNCAPEDRVPFLELLLDQLRPGWPQSFLIDLLREALVGDECQPGRAQGILPRLL